MKKIALEKLVEAAEACKVGMKTEKSITKRELFSRAYAELTDIIEKMVEEEISKE